jgi:hypothetical protein
MGGIGSGRTESEEIKRSETIIFKVLPEEKLQIKANAFMSGKRISQYVRELVFKSENLTLSVQNERLSKVLGEIEDIKGKLNECKEIIGTLENEIKSILRDGGKR